MTAVGEAGYGGVKAVQFRGFAGLDRFKNTVKFALQALCE